MIISTICIYLGCLASCLIFGLQWWSCIDRCMFYSSSTTFDRRQSFAEAEPSQPPSMGIMVLHISKFLVVAGSSTPRDPLAALACEPKTDSGDILRLAYTSHRQTLCDILLKCLERGGHHLGPERTEGEGVDGHIWPKALCQVAREPGVKQAPRIE